MPEPSENPDAEMQEITECVRRAILQLGEMKEVEDKLKIVSERLSKITPPSTPEEPEKEEDS